MRFCFDSLSPPCEKRRRRAPLTAAGAVVADAVVAAAAVRLGLVAAGQAVADTARDTNVPRSVVVGAGVRQLALDLLQVTLASAAQCQPGDRLGQTHVSL